MYYKGLSVKFQNGKNNVVEIFEPIAFKIRRLKNLSKITINGNNNNILFDTTKHKLLKIKILNIGSGNRIEIGKNWYPSGEVTVDFCCQNNKIFKIGENCMFGQNISFMMGDWHTIFDKNTKECINATSQGIIIGNHVWLARHVNILKDVQISDNSIVGLGSIVTKKFTEENCIIAGTPAKIVKKNINWHWKNIT